MRWTDPAHPFWKWLLAACAVATAVPLWAFDYLPFTDLPQHAAQIATLRHWGDPAWSGPYELGLGQTQYLLYYLAGALLAFPLGSAERANVALLSAVAIGLPYALRSLLRATGRDERLALFAPALFWSQSLIIGFFNYLAALPVLLWALALVVRGTAPVRLALIAVALFYLHLSAFVFLLPAALILVAGQAGPRAAPRKMLWAFPSAALFLFWLLRGAVTNPQDVGWTQEVRAQWEPIGDALRHLPEATLDIWHAPADETALLMLALAAVLLAWPRARPAEEDAAARQRGALAGLVLMAAVFYFFFPVSIGWLWQLNERYAIVAALLAPALLRPPPGLRGAAPLLLAATAGIFSAGTAFAEIRAFQAEARGFDEVLARAQPGKRLLALIYDSGSHRARFAPFLHFGSYYRARKGGVASFSFSELPQALLRYRRDQAPPPKPMRWEWNPYSFRNDREGPYFDYVLARGHIDPFVRSPGGPPFERVAQAGPWVLWAKK